jgi:hypothetical protein
MKTSEASKQLSLRTKEAQDQIEEDSHVAYLKTLLDNLRGNDHKEHWEKKGSGA